MIEIRWQILEEEGRVIKTACDLARLPCRLTNKHQQHKDKEQLQQGQEQPNKNKSRSTTTHCISSIEDLQQLNASSRQLAGLFGTTKQETQSIRQLIQLHNSNIKKYLRFPVLDYHHGHPLPTDEFWRYKESQVVLGVGLVEQIVAGKEGRFLCGERVSVVDLLFYFDVCNLVYFGRNQSEYPQLLKWFQDVYQLQEVKSITHQWFSMAKEIRRGMQTAKPSSKL